MTLELSDKELALLKDVVEEAQAISEQLKVQVPESQRPKFKKQAKELSKLLKRLK